MILFSVLLLAVGTCSQCECSGSAGQRRRSPSPGGNRVHYSESHYGAGGWAWTRNRQIYLGFAEEEQRGHAFAWKVCGGMDVCKCPLLVMQRAGTCSAC